MPPPSSGRPASRPSAARQGDAPKPAPKPAAPAPQPPAPPFAGLDLDLRALYELFAPLETPTDQGELAEDLADFFDPSELEWMPGTVTRDKAKGLAMAFVTNRAIQQRLDVAVGVGNWRNEFKPGPLGGIVCGLSLRIVYGNGRASWVTKWDGADNTHVEATKGGLSASMKRAAVQWGIGRYLYELPAQWVPLTEHGRFKSRPEVPPAFVPQRGPKKRRDDQGVPGGDARRAREERGFHVVGVEWCGGDAARWDRVRPRIIEGYATQRGLTLREPSANELGTDHLRELAKAIRSRIEKGTAPPDEQPETPPEEPASDAPAGDAEDDVSFDPEDFPDDDGTGLEGEEDYGPGY